MCQAEPFDTIVSVSKLRDFWRKVSYRYRISIEICKQESIISVSVSKFQSKKYRYQYRYHNFSPHVSWLVSALLRWLNRPSKANQNNNFHKILSNKGFFKQKCGIKFSIKAFYESISISIGIDFGLCIASISRTFFSQMR